MYFSFFYLTFSHALDAFLYTVYRSCPLEGISHVLLLYKKMGHHNFLTFHIHQSLPSCICLGVFFFQLSVPTVILLWLNHPEPEQQKLYIYYLLGTINTLTKKCKVCVPLTRETVQIYERKTIPFPPQCEHAHQSRKRKENQIKCRRSMIFYLEANAMEKKQSSRARPRPSDEVSICTGPQGISYSLQTDRRDGNTPLTSVKLQPTTGKLEGFH